MRKLIQIAFILTLLGIPASYDLKIPFFRFTSKSQYNNTHKKNSGFISIKNRNIILGNETDALPFEDYIDYHHSGYYVNYDKMGENIAVFFKKQKLFQWKEKSNYPRIALPYLILFSSDFSKAEIFHIKKGFAKPVKTIVSKNMISSWASSPKGTYIIMGDLGGNFYIYSYKNNKFESRELKQSRINYIKGVSIDDEGNFLLLGSLYPELLAMGKFGQPSIDAFSVPSTGRSRKKIDYFPHYSLIEGRGKYFLLSVKDHRMTQHRNPYRYFQSAEHRLGDFIYSFVLSRSGNSNCLDVFINSRYFYSLRFESTMLPVFKHRKNASPLLFWDEGVLEI